MRVNGTPTLPSVPGDGSSWLRPLTDLQQAIDAASSGDEIRVAQGTYFPRKRATASDPRSATFRLKDGVKIIGGYSGALTVVPIPPDPANFVCWLSGDIGTKGGASDNCYHVVTAQAVSDQTALEGFRITAGRANGAGSDAVGGGYYARFDSHAKINNCIFDDHAADGKGGAIHLEGGSSVFTDCVIDANTSPKGGGAYIQNDTASFVNCQFRVNKAVDGGAVFVEFGAMPSFTGCNFSLNEALQPAQGALHRGGGIFIDGRQGFETVATLVQCFFSQNKATSGGGAYSASQATLDMDRCTFNANDAPTGAGLYTHTTSGKIVGSTFRKHRASNIGGGMYCFQSSLTLERCDFIENFAQQGGGGILVSGGNPQFNLCNFVKNTTHADGGGMHQNAAETTFTGCVFQENGALAEGSRGGGCFASRAGSLTANSCRFLSNQAFYGGGISIALDQESTVLVASACLFERNQATTSGNNTILIPSGGAILCAAHEINNCTFSENVSEGFIGGVRSWGGSVGGGSVGTMRGCIFVENEAISEDAGALSVSAGRFLIEDCRFFRNRAGTNGGAASNSADVTYRRCVFDSNVASGEGGAIVDHGGLEKFFGCVLINNEASVGGAVRAASSLVGQVPPFLQLQNCTLVNNRATSKGGAIDIVDGGTLGAANCIFWGNFRLNGNQIEIATSTTRKFTNCLIEGDPWPGTGLIEANPLFLQWQDPDGPDDKWGTADDGLQILPSSPCTNVGSNADVAGGETTDFLGNPRIRDKIVDIGAYEAPYKDSDLDDYGDETEERAGTSPFDFKDHPDGQLLVTEDLSKIVFYPKVGESYQLESSSNLRKWRPAGGIVTWEERVLEYAWFATGVARENYFRARRTVP